MASIQGADAMSTNNAFHVPRTKAQKDVKKRDLQQANASILKVA